MKKEITDYKTPEGALYEFEANLATFTGASGVVVTDSVEHAIEIGLRYKMPKMYATIPPRTHYSTPMILKSLGIEYMFSDDEWENEFRIHGSNVYVSKNHFAKDMFQLENPNQKKIVCVSFGHGSSLDIGGGGAILTNDKAAYNWMKLAANGGRDLKVDHWEDQKEFSVGYHYGMRPADAIIGMDKLANEEFSNCESGYENYPDLRDLVINN